MSMERYIRLDELERYLRRSQLEILADHRFQARQPVKNAAETVELLDKLLRDEAEYRQLDEIWRWAEEHAVTGDLTLPTLTRGVSRSKPGEGSAKPLPDRDTQT